MAQLCGNFSAVIRSCPFSFSSYQKPPPVFDPRGSVDRVSVFRQMIQHAKLELNLAVLREVSAQRECTVI